MANDDDFTFCQVGVPNDLDGVDSEKVVENVRDIKIDGGSLNGSFDDSSTNILWKDKLANNSVNQKQGTVGSLSFSVTDASTKRPVNEPPEQRAAEDAGSSLKSFPAQKALAKKSAPRAKVPFEKGYSQMDWVKLTRTHPDLAGLKGQSNKRLISLNEVKQHQNEDAMWTVLKGRVYNIAPYMKFHPGGADMLMKAVGKDCTSLFNKYHAWVNAEFLLEKCLVGVLDDSR